MGRRVFVSYSRKDGTEIAHRLRDIVKAAGCKVWIDLEDSGGASWSREIEDGLNNCEVLTAVLSHGSYVSEICRSEQIWALECGKRVIPVLATPDAPSGLFDVAELSKIP